NSGLSLPCLSSALMNRKYKKSLSFFVKRIYNKATTIGINRRNEMKEILEFNHKKQCGLWLILIGIVLIVAVICGGEFFVNPFVFLIGYYACFFGVNVNKKVREKLSQGDISKKQIKMIYFSIATLFILMFCIAGPFIPGWHWRQIWLGVLMATSIHFFLWFFVHGWSMVVLGIVCMVIVTMGYIFTGIPVSVICIADAMVKLICGIYLLFIAKPSKYIPNPELFMSI
ncbi:DUF6609 family protein, partial [Lachnospiraceae bacterium 54-11]